MPEVTSNHSLQLEREPAPEAVVETEDALTWLERVLPRAMRRLTDSEDMEHPLLQLPLAQLRLAHALYREDSDAEARAAGETMGHLSAQLGVRQNALTQAADRLVQRKLAERISDPHDRRIVRLRLTETGYDWVRSRRARRRAHLDKLWATLEPTERDALLEAVRTLETLSRRLPNTAALAAAPKEGIL
jgi:DNA-binding MarR family transcriptional regulator